MPARNVRARIEDLIGFYSGHADRGGLLDFIFRRSGARFERDACTVFINHGDDRKRNALAEAIRERIAAEPYGDGRVTKVEVPSAQSQWFDLRTCTWVPDVPARDEDDMPALLLRMVLEQKRTNDLLAELLRLQKPQKQPPIKRQKN